VIESTVGYEDAARSAAQIARAAPPGERVRFLIRPTTGWGSVDLTELWAHRDLIYFLVWRDIKVRYKQTVLGAGWALVQPLLTMAVFSLFFGKLVKVPSDGVPYALFSYLGLVPWTFVANGLVQASNSLVLNSNMLTKVYFPRLAMPMAAVVAGMLDFVLAFSFTFGMMAYYGVTPNYHIVFLPLFFVLAILVALSVSLWAAALHVLYRDVRYILPFFLQFWMFATPIAYPSSLLQEPWRTLYGINPMVGVVEGFRWSVLGTATAPGMIIFVSTAVAIVLLITGALYFRKMERTFADVI
jgi:lipopolysaccharide transport system permease protein